MTAKGKIMLEYLPSIVEYGMALIKDYLIICTALVGIYNINTWRKEHINKKRIDLAEKTLCLFYEARDAIKYVRNPLIFTSEGNSRHKNENETYEESEALRKGHITAERFEKFKDVLVDLTKVKYRFKAMFNNGEESFKNLHDIINEILNASIALPSVLMMRDLDQETKQHKKELKSIIWGFGSEDDHITPIVDEIVNSMENICKKIIN